MTDLGNDNQDKEITPKEKADNLRKLIKVIGCFFSGTILLSLLVMYLHPETRLLYSYVIPFMIFFIVFALSYLWRLAERIERGEINKDPKIDETAWMNKFIHIPKELMVLPVICGAGSIALLSFPSSAIFNVIVPGIIIAFFIAIMVKDAMAVSRNGGERIPENYIIVRRGRFIEYTAYIVFTAVIILGVLIAYNWMQNQP